MTKLRLVNAIAIRLLILSGLLFVSQSLQTVRAQVRATANSTIKNLPPEKIGHIGHLDYVNGFRGRKFGTDIGQFKDLILVKDSGSEKAYSSKDEKFEMGDGIFQSINYTFYKDKFMGVLLSAKGEQNCQYIYQVFVTAFGNGKKPDNDINKGEYFWAGRTAAARLSFKSPDYLELWIGNIQLQAEHDKEYGNKLLEAAAKAF